MHDNLLKNLLRSCCWLSLVCAVITPVFAAEGIPLMNNAPSALNYHQIPIDKVVESNEPLVDASKFGIATKSYYFHKFDAALPQVMVRKGVAMKLVAANQILKPQGLEILVLDGYRPITLQRELWNHFIVQAKKTLKNPTEKECVEFAGKFCSDPRKFKCEDWHTWPTHITGGAVDVTLCDTSSGRELNMGGVFDDASEVSYTDYYERNAGPENAASFEEARKNRHLLYGAMTAAGFANYPYEWWHFDYGTQMWVMNGHKHQHAFYGRAKY